MRDPGPLLILGTGLAGYTLAREFRKRDRARSLCLVTRDDGCFYSKPMLSNAIAQGRTPEALCQATAGKQAETLDARILTGVEAVRIDRERRQVLVDGEWLTYGDLVLAVGAEPIRLEIEGDGASEVLTVNDRLDYARFRERLRPGMALTLIGAGLIGCEFADDLLAGGWRSRVVDIGSHPLGRLVPPETGAALAEALAEKGVSWHFEDAVVRIDQEGDRLGIRTRSGAEWPTDLVLSAVGLRPRTGLAAEAGLATGHGIRVDRFLRSSDPHVWALGDCAEVEGLVLPFVMPLMQAARALAATLAGTPTPVRYPAMPVVVKTPDYPVVVCPPRNGWVCDWRIHTCEGRDIEAHCLDAEGRLLGFALGGGATARKQVLAKSVPDWLPSPAE